VREPHVGFSAGEPRDRDATSPRRACLSVYDGTDLAGYIAERGGEFAAFDPNHKLIGAFTNQRDAMRAIPPVRTERGAS
jgi:hypothetical protein